MNRYLYLVGGALLLQAAAASGCAQGNEAGPGTGATLDAGSDVSAEAAGDAAAGSAGTTDGGAGKDGAAGDASMGGAAGSAGDGGSAGDAGSAGEGGSAGAAGSGGAGGGGGAAGKGGSGGSGGTGGAAGTSGAAGAAGTGQGGTGGTPAAWSHTIFIDGSNDFNSEEDFPTSSSGYTAYITWDSSNIYVGMEGVDVGSLSDTKWVLIYLSGSSGTTTGQTYASQQPTLPFSAHWHLRWKTSNWSSMQVFSSSWGEAAWDLSGDIHQTGNFVEFKIPLSDLGYPVSVSMHVCMLNEASGGEWTYAGVPSDSFADGTDPNFTKYFEFDLKASKAPGQYVSK